MIRARARKIIVRRRSYGQRMLRNLRQLGSVVFLVLLLSGIFSYTRAGTYTRVHAATSSSLNFQARLYDASGSTVADGTYSIQFRLYDDSAGGTNEWTETQN